MCLQKNMHAHVTRIHILIIFNYISSSSMTYIIAWYWHIITNPNFDRMRVPCYTWYINEFSIIQLSSKEKHVEFHDRTLGACRHRKSPATQLEHERPTAAPRLHLSVSQLQTCAAALQLPFAPGPQDAILGPWWSTIFDPNSLTKKVLKSLPKWMMQQVSSNLSLLATSTTFNQPICSSVINDVSVINDLWYRFHF